MKMPNINVLQKLIVFVVSCAAGSLVEIPEWIVSRFNLLHC